MPSLFTHYLCGKKSLKDIKVVNENVFNLGTQGPDIFFFHNQLSLKKSSDVSEIGGNLHSKNINKFFENNLLYIKENQKDKDMLISYFMGFCSHYALDTTAHPYVFYHSGFDSNGELEDDRYMNYHREFETTLDYLISKYEENTTPYYLNSKKVFKLTKKEKEIIAKMLEYSINNSYEEKISKEDVLKSINEFYLIINILRDRFGIKKELSSKIESLLHIRTKPSTLIHPVKLNDGIDYLNKKNNVWYLPWDKTKSSNQSFIELYEIGVEKSYDYIRMVKDFFDEKVELGRLLEELGDNSYSTGKDCAENLLFRYHDSVYEK